MLPSSPSPRRRFLAWLLPALGAAVLGAGLVAQTTAPAIQVLDGTTAIAVNATDGFAATPAGVANAKTFTVKNTGTANLLVSEAIAVPPGFTLMASFPGVPNATVTSGTTTVPAYTIAPNASATFVVALNAANAGSYSGSVSFNTNVSGTNPFVFKVSGKVLPPPALRIIDDAGAGFTHTAGWTTGAAGAGTSGKLPFQHTYAHAPSGTGAETATWTFTGLEPGQYKVAATWVGYAGSATNTPFTVLDGSTPLGTVRVNQTTDAAGFSDAGSAWHTLGTYTITGSTLAVTASDDANGTAVADAVWIERVGYPGQIIDDSSATGFSLPAGSWSQTAGAADFQGGRTAAAQTDTPGTATATARWTFSVTPGTYRVMAGYHGQGSSSGYASNAPYSVYNNTTNLTTTPVRVNQRTTPADLVDAKGNWKDLGFFNITSRTLVVELTNDANGTVDADAVRVERVNTPTSPSLADTVRFLEQATWGPTPALVAQVQSRGFGGWISDQFAAAATSYPTLPSYNSSDKVTNNVTTSCYSDGTTNGGHFRTACLRDHYSMYPLQNQFFTNALYGDDQLRQRMAWTLHKIWVISGVEVRQSAWVAPYLQVLSRNEDGHGKGTFGNYRTLMYNVTLNAGMGNYLNMAGSKKSQPNENYPREIMQLFTIGLYELNPDGSQKLSGGQPIATYNQTLVDNMTKVFTGWNYAPAHASGIPNYVDPMRLNGAATENAVNHDFSQKHLLRGHTQAAVTGSGTTGTAGVTHAYAQLNDGLDNIYGHPSLPPFVCKQLIQSLVTSNPSPAYVARVVDTFNRNRTNVYQMRLVTQAILLDPEARGDRKNADNYGKLKEPVLYVNNLMRLFHAQSDNLSQNSDGYLNPKVVSMGQDTFRPPSVFSYYSPGKVAVGGNPPVLGPEFQLLNTSTALARANFVNSSFTPNSSRTVDVVQAHGTTPSGVIPGTTTPLVPTGSLGTAVDVSQLLPYAGDPSGLADVLNTYLLHGIMTPDMKADIVTAVSAVADTNPRKRVHTAIYLVVTSSRYQVQK